MKRSIDLPPLPPGKLNIPQWVSLLHDRGCQVRFSSVIRNMLRSTGILEA